MKTSIAIAAATILAPLTAVSAQSLPGVSDKETSITFGKIAEYHRGNGDVLFVRDQRNQWYRLQTNPNCLDGQTTGERFTFIRRGSDDRIDRLTRLDFPETKISCAIDSIRRSVPPPQVDSNSPVTLD